MKYCVTIERTQRQQVWFEADTEDVACRAAGKIMDGFDSSSEFTDEEWDYCLVDESGLVIEPYDR